MCGEWYKTNETEIAVIRIDPIWPHYGQIEGVFSYNQGHAIFYR